MSRVSKRDVGPILSKVRELILGVSISIVYFTFVLLCVNTQLRNVRIFIIINMLSAQAYVCPTIRFRMCGSGSTSTKYSRWASTQVRVF